MQNSPGSRLSKADRRQQLLDTALVIVREEGADRLTLGRLAERAGVSKPIAYEHFVSRAGLLTALYKQIDGVQADALRQTLAAAPRDLDVTVTMLSAAYMHCYADTGGEWHAVGAALSGSEEMDTVHQELLASYVALFVGALEPHSQLPVQALRLRCVGLVGAGESLSASMIRGDASEKEAAETLAVLMRGAIS